MAGITVRRMTTQGSNEERSPGRVDDLRRRNAALARSLSRASAELLKAKDQLQAMAQPPVSVAVMLRLDSAAQVDGAEHGGRRASAKILMGSRTMIVPVAATVDADRLACGQQVLLSERMVLVGVRDAPAWGPVRQVVQTLDAGRLLVDDHDDESSVACRSGALAGRSVTAGDRVIMDPSGRIALELLPRQDDTDLVLEEIPDVTFEDIGGLDEQIERIRDAVQLPFQHRELFARYDLHPPKGVLLYGPPGNGKTLIAKAIAHVLAQGRAARGAGVFLSVKGPELLNKFVGESERLIRGIFKRARQRAASGRPVIVFIDEMDSLLRTRGSGVSSDVETTIVPQFLAELDGVEALSNVIVIGASNRVDMIDPAVLRPGRLDVKIRIDRPGSEQAAAILRRYVTGALPLAPGTDAETLIRQVVADAYARDERRLLGGSAYFADVISGAMLKNIVDRAKTLAVKASVSRGRDVALDAGMFAHAVQEEFVETADSFDPSNGPGDEHAPAPWGARP